MSLVLAEVVKSIKSAAEDKIWVELLWKNVPGEVS